MLVLYQSSEFIEKSRDSQTLSLRIYLPLGKIKHKISNKGSERVDFLVPDRMLRIDQIINSGEIRIT